MIIWSHLSSCLHRHQCSSCRTNCFPKYSAGHCIGPCCSQCAKWERLSPVNDSCILMHPKTIHSSDGQVNVDVCILGHRAMEEDTAGHTTHHSLPFKSCGWLANRAPFLPTTSLLPPSLPSCLPSVPPYIPPSEHSSVAPQGPATAAVTAAHSTQ